MQIPVNFADAEPATDFPRFPAGTYLLEPTKIEMKTNDDGKQRIVVSNKIIMGPDAATEYHGGTIINSYQLSDKGKPFLTRFIVACGTPLETLRAYGASFDINMCIGKQYTARVTLKTVNGKEYNNIDQEALAQSGAPAMAPTPGLMAAMPTAQAAPPPAQAPAPIPGAAPVAPGMVPGAVAAPPAAGYAQPPVPGQPAAAPGAAPTFAAPPPPPGTVPGQGQ